MTIAYLHVALICVVACASVAAVVLTAPSLEAGVDRMRMILRVVCRSIIITGYVMAAMMLIWGVNTRDEQLMYFSMMPLVAAILTSNFLTRSGLR